MKAGCRRLSAWRMPTMRRSAAGWPGCSIPAVRTTPGHRQPTGSDTMQLLLEPRLQQSRLMRYLSPLIAAVLTLIIGALLFAALGRNPFVALHAYFIAPISDLYGITTWLLKSAPLLLIGMGLAIGFRANVWNIGAEGQYTLGAICGGGVALLFYGHGGWWLLPLMLVAGAAGGAAWAAIPAFLKTRFNTNE